MRLTDSELADVAHRVAIGVCHQCEGLKQTEYGATCHVCDGTGAFALATGTMEVVLMELIERRAADLSAEDREALRDARQCIAHHCTSVDSDDKHHRRALSVLDRLLAGKP